MAGGLAGCDQGTQSDQPLGAGGAIHLVGQYPPVGQAMPDNSRIEFAFNRYLLPSTITRQSFVLRPAGGGAMTPTIAYDPVARIVSLAPLMTDALKPDQTYTVDIDRNTLRAIDGAQLASSETTSFSIQVVAGGGPAFVPPAVNYCADIQPLWTRCSFCHTGPAGTFAGLDLSNLSGLAATAIGKAAHGANLGPSTLAQPAGPVFGLDMPVIDPGLGGGGGDPGNSWLMYKLLIATPSATSSVTPSGGAPTDVSKAHLAVQPALADEAHDGERANLLNQVAGREMPFPTSAEALADPAVNSQTLSVDDLERVSLWIASGDGGAEAAASLLPASCP